MIDNPRDVVSIVETDWNEKHVLVVGDVMLDKYAHGKVERISPEAPVPVVHAFYHTEQPGGAANVAMNIAALGAKATLVGFIGDDKDGESVARLLQAAGVRAELLKMAGTPTTSKLRILGGSQQIVRLDVESVVPHSQKAYVALIEQTRQLLQRADAVILSDYAKGALSEEVCHTIISEASKAGLPVLVDPKNRDLLRYSGATALCPNLKELALATGGDAAALDMILLHGQALVSKLRLEYLAVTMGEKGITILQQSKRTHAPAIAKQVFDVSGAGDTVIATLALAATSGVPLEIAAGLANIAAGIVVGKVGTVPVAKYELVAALTAASATLVGEKALDASRLLVRAAEWRAAGERIVFTNGCFDILHIGHIALLEECRRFGTKVIVAINSDASVRQLKGPSRPIVGAAERAKVLSALAATDAVVIFDKPTPLELIVALRPDVLVKGGDYTEAGIVGAAEVKSWGGQVRIVPMIAGASTTKIVRAMEERNANPSLSDFVQ